MASNKERSFPIERFRGVNRNLDREDLGPESLWAAENLWEKRIGLLESRYGSDNFHSTDFVWPTNINKVMSPTKLYKSSGESVRMAAVQCTPDTEELNALPAGVTVSLVNDANGYFTEPMTVAAVDYGMAPTAIYLRFVGYGIDKYMSLTYTAITGYDTTNQKLRISISAALDSNITGYEIYAINPIGTSGTPLGAFSLIWLGYQSLVRQTYPLTKDYLYVAHSQGGSVTTDLEVGELRRSAEKIDAANFDISLGTLKRGKTYYVAILPLRSKFNSTAVRRYGYRAGGIETTVGGASLYDGVDVVAVTIPEGDGTDNGYIYIEDINFSTATCLLCIGESPEILFPAKIINDTNVSSDPDHAKYAAEIYDFPEGCPSIIDAEPISHLKHRLQFRCSSFSLRDMLIRINDDDTISPIFYSRTFINMNDSEGDPSFPFLYLYIGLDDTLPLVVPHMGNGSHYDYVQSEDKLFFVNDYNAENELTGNLGGIQIYTRTGSNYSMCDGNGATPVIQEYQGASLIPSVVTTTTAASSTLLTSTTYSLIVSRVNPSTGLEEAATDVQAHTTGTTDKSIQITMPATTGYTYNIYFGTSSGELRQQSTLNAPAASVVVSSLPTGSILFESRQLRLPSFKYIKEFNGHIVCSGGSPSYDEVKKENISAAYDIYFSRALNPYNFSIPGIGEGVLQSFRAGNDNEPVSGLAIYSNSTGDSGPFNQLIVGKKSSLHVLNDLPSIGGSDSTVRTLSGRVGIANHFGAVNTPIGTIILAVDNVYLVRESGEPAPVGQEISDILRAADLSKAFACYHDRHYKLSFRHPDYSDGDYANENYNNAELWLNIDKVIAAKGQPDWVGPMFGTSIQSCFVEDHSQDGLTYNEARDRIVCSGKELMIFKADVDPGNCDDAIYDLGQPIYSYIETKDFEVGPEDNNWNKLLKRLYLKIKTNRKRNDPLRTTISLYVDGALHEETVVNLFTLSENYFDETPLCLEPFFVKGRPRGRTVRIGVKFEGRVGIGGLQINYEQERRRI